MDLHVFRFQSFLLDPAARELLHDGERVAIPPKSLECLEYLVRHRERAVGRDELISAVWGRVDVSDALLAQTLLRARRAVGDTGNEQTTIRTVTRFGYQWVAAVEECERPVSTPAQSLVQSASSHAAEPPLPASDSSASPASARPQGFRGYRFLAGIGLIAALLVALGLFWSKHAPEPARVDHQLYVVAPAKVAPADGESAWIRLGLMDYVATRLREDGKLSVLPSVRMMAMLDAAGSGSDVAPRELMVQANAGHLVEVTASRKVGGWHVRLDHEAADGSRKSYGADDSVVLSAADKAIAAMLVGLGVEAATVSSAQANPLDESTQRIDAALLEGNLPAARAVLASLSAESRQSPQVRVREGQILLRSGRIDEADRVYSALEARLQEWPVDVQAQALMGLGGVAVRRLDFATAEKRYAESLAVLGDKGSQQRVGDGFNGRGVARAAQQQFELALGDFSRARIALSQAGDTPGVATIDTNLGLLEAKRGQWSQALDAFDRAISVFMRFRISDNQAAALLGKGKVQLAMVDYAGASYSAERAGELAAKLENPVLNREIALLRASLMLRLGQLNTAASLLTAIESDPSSNAQDLLVELDLERGNAADALARAREAAVASPSGHELDLLVRAAIAAKAEPGTLAEIFAKATKPQGATKADDENAIWSALAHARWLAMQGNVDAAANAYGQILNSAGDSITPGLKLAVTTARIEFLVSHGQLDRALELSVQVEGFADRDYAAARAMVALYRAMDDEKLLATALERLHRLAGERRIE